MRHGILMLLALLIFYQTKAQTEVCGSEILLEHHLKHDPSLKASMDKKEQRIAQNYKHSGLNFKPYDIVTIPIVFHIIHKGEKIGEGSNLSDKRIHAAVAGLNARFSGKLGAGVDTRLRFCLAVRDPNGNFTTGINRVDGRVLKGFDSLGLGIFSGQGAPHANEVKDLSKWPVTQYYNIWVVHNIVGPNGFASFPSGIINPYDGTTVTASGVNYTNYLLTHELGHGFNLYHTFNQVYRSCPSQKDCAKKDDLVCDTPPSVDLGKGYCQRYNPCTSNYSWYNSVNNYMTYCAGKDRFTSGQMDRMHASIKVTVRDSLLKSKACIPAHNNDLGVANYINCDTAIWLVIKNYGANLVKNAQVKLMVNDTLKISRTWNGTLKTYQTDTIWLSSQFLSKYKGADIKIWTELPNKIKDTINLNDTLFVEDLYSPIASGTYLIGSKKADYKTISDAVEALNKRGICGSVTFNIQADTYNEQVTFQKIRGVSSTDTIVFQALSGKNDDVVINFKTDADSSNYIFHLNQASHLTFKDLSFGASGNVNYTTLILLENGACNNSMINCVLKGQSSTYQNSSAALVHSPATLDSSNVFRHCSFLNGGYGIFYMGAHGLTEGLVVDSCQFINQNMTSIYVQGLHSPYFNRNIFRTKFTSIGAMYLSSCTDQTQVLNNKIEGQYIWGIQLQGCESSLEDGKFLIANNLIHPNSKYSNSGISLRFTYGAHILHNSIRITHKDTISKALFCSRSGSLKINNNIFSNEGDGFSLYFEDIDFKHSDINFNSIYSSSNKLVYDNGTFKKLTTWRSHSNKDFASLSGNPQYLNDGSFQICSVPVSRGGKYSNSIPIDFEDQFRPKVSPSIGAIQTDLRTLSLGPDLSNCDSIQISSNIKGLKYLWNTKDTTPILKIKKSGLYSLTVWNQCFSQTDSVDVTIKNKPIVRIYNNNSLCKGDTIKSSFQHSVYLWNTGDTTDNIKVYKAGEYWLRSENECGVSYDTVSVQVDSLPDLNLTYNNSGCDSAFIYAHSKSAGYWNDKTTADSIIVYQSGSYWHQIDHQCGIVKDSVTLEIRPSPSLNLGNDTAACDEYLLETQSDYSFLWNTKDTTNWIKIYETGSYFATITDSIGCKNKTDPIQIEIYDLPKPYLGADTTIYKSDSLVLSLKKSFASYKWDDGSVLKKRVIYAGEKDSILKINVTVIDSNGCSGFDTIVVTVSTSGFVFNDDMKNNLSLYPNPVNDYLNIKHNSESKYLTLKIYNLMGEEIITEKLSLKHSSIYFNNQPAGLYILLLEDESNSTQYTTRFIKR